MVGAPRRQDQEARSTVYCLPRTAYWAIALIGLVAVVVLGIRIWPRRPPSPLEQARAAYQRRDWPAAASLARDVLRQRPGDVEALHLLARSHGRMKHHQTAQDLFRRVDDRVMEAEDFFLLGSGLVEQDRADPAVVVLEKARSLDPAHAETLQELTRLYARLRRLGEAAVVASRLATIPGWEARGGVILGGICQERHDPAGAKEAFTRALQADPRLRGAIVSPSVVRKQLARALLETDDPGAARSQLESVLASGPDPEASWLLSRAYLLSGDAVKATQALTAAHGFAADNPLTTEPAPYVGAKACAQCHATICRTQQNSRHARTLVLPQDLAEIPLPKNPVPDPAVPKLTHSLHHEGGTIALEVKLGDQIRRAVVEYALGSDNHGQTMIGRDQKGMARVFRLSSFEHHAIWDLTPNVALPQSADPGELIGRGMSADSVAKCVDCHVTSIRAARDRSVPEAADRGIGCERCHGPGGNHLAAVVGGFDDLAIMRPSLASPAQIIHLCATCHNSDDPSIPETDALTIRFQTLTMPRSRCYTETAGGLSCLTCHDPHRDAETKAEHYEAQCRSCHAKALPKPSHATRRAMLPQGARRVTCPVNPARNCLTCHMPATPSAIHHTAFTDHHIRVHRPDETAH